MTYHQNTPLVMLFSCHANNPHVAIVFSYLSIMYLLSTSHTSNLLDSASTLSVTDDECVCPGTRPPIFTIHHQLLRETTAIYPLPRRRFQWMNHHGCGNSSQLTPLLSLSTSGMHAYTRADHTDPSIELYIIKRHAYSQQHFFPHKCTIASRYRFVINISLHIVLTMCISCWRWWAVQNTW